MGGFWSVCVWSIYLMWTNKDLCFDGFLLFVLLQVRIQLGQGSAATVTKTMLKNEGVAAFYKVWFYETYYVFCFYHLYWEFIVFVIHCQKILGKDKALLDMV